MCKDFGVRPVFKSAPYSTQSSLLRSNIPSLQKIVYKGPCTCRKVYIGKSRNRVKEHKDEYVSQATLKAALSKHTWTEDHPTCWDGTRVM